MTTTPTRPRFGRVLLSAILLATGAVLMPAAPVQAQATTSTSQEKAPPTVKTFDLDFMGGTMADYVKAVQRAADDMNIIISPEAGTTPMPPVQVKSVSLLTALRLAEDRHTEIDGVVHEVRLAQFGAKGSSTVHRIYTWVAPGRISPGRPKQADIQTHVISVLALLEADLSAEDILTAVEIAIELGETETPLRIRFHEETGLLILNGPRDMLQTVDQLIDVLRDSVHEQMEMEDARGQLEMAQAVIEAMEAELNEVRELAEGVQDENEDLERHAEAVQHEYMSIQQRAEEQLRALKQEAQDEIREREMRIRELEQVLARMEQRIQQLEAQLSGSEAGR